MNASTILMQYLLGLDWPLVDTLLAMATETGPAASDNRFLGKLAFAGVFAALIVWLVMIPAERIDMGDEKPVWWKNVRIWAILIAATQLTVYLMWP